MAGGSTGAGSGDEGSGPEQAGRKSTGGGPDGGVVDGVYRRSSRVPRVAIDANGHVNNRAYLRWMEEIAVEHSAAVGWPLARYFDLGATWVVRSHFIEYLRPAFRDELLHARTWVADMAHRRSLRRYLFTRGADEEEVVVRAETVWVFVDLDTGRPRPIPEPLSRDFTVVSRDVTPRR